jgi:pyruvate-formate lyase-activating enzyme
MKDSKVFPIENESACVFKWSWNTFRFYTGHSSSCHRIKAEFVPIEKFDDFHNMPAVIKDREQMKQGQWPDAGRGCEFCHRVEQQQGESDRTYHNRIPGLTPVDFDLGSNNKVTPRISEIFLNNTCDLACVYCTPIFSSRINDELKTHGPWPTGTFGKQLVPKRVDHEAYIEKYRHWLGENYTKLAFLNIQGGEPLLQKELWNFLEFMKEHANPDLVIAINTNLNANIATLKKFIAIARDLILTKKIKRIDINASLDCWGPQAEFIRWGLDLTNWQRNFEYVMSHKWIRLSVHQVITSLSLPTMLNLQQIITTYKQQHPKIQQDYHMVDSDFEKIYHPEIFGAEFFHGQFEDLVRTFPVATDWDHESKKRLEGYAKLQASAHINPERLLLLKGTLDQLDVRRKTNWRELFPGIDNFLTTNGI